MYLPPLIKIGNRMNSSNTTPANSQCPAHKKNKNILCMNPGCKGSRLCCELCRIKDHSHHVFREIKDLNNIIHRLDTKNDQGSKNVTIHNSLKKAFDTMNRFPKSFNQMDSYLRTVRASVPFKLMPAFTYLNLLSLGELAGHCQKMVEPEREQQFEHIAKLYRFLSTNSIQSQEEVSQIIDTVAQKMDGAINKLRTNIQNAFSQFYYQIEKCEIKNWYEVYRQKNTKNLKQKPSSNEGKERPTSKHHPVISLLEQTQEQKKQVGQRQRFVDNEQLNQMIEKMFEEVFELRPIGNPAQKIVPQIAVRQQADKVLVQSQESLNKFSRFVFSAPNANKKITKNEIMTLITKLMIDRNYTHNLKQFIMEGPNQFDLDCLKKLATCFPNLTKFNYIWNFEEAGLRLQKEQAFFEIPRSLEKDMKNFEMTQQLLDAYGQLQHLQNISINQVEMFAFKQFKIKNKNILHLTIGEYVQPNQQEILPNCLKNEALLFNGLITLNIFNVKKIDGGFMQSIIGRNLDTLRNLWLSECIELEESFYAAIERSRLESIMFDQIKKINHKIIVPKTLKTLVIDNCQLYCKKPFYGLSMATNLTNFSIFDSIFHEANQIGDQVLEQLSQIPDSECKSVTNLSLKNLQKMTKLKELCIDNTNICLYQLSRFSKILSKINKLAIVGVQIQKESEQELKAKNFPAQYSKFQYTLEKILKKSPNLRLISLKFEDDMANIDIELFKQVQHVSISAITNPKYKKKLLREFVEALKINCKRVNIV